MERVNVPMDSVAVSVNARLVAVCVMPNEIFVVVMARVCVM